MKSENEIKKKLEQVFQHRLDVRLDKYLPKRFKNCKYNFSMKVKDSEIFLCKNEDVLNKDSKIIHVCDNDKQCANCQFFENSYDYEKIKKQLMQDISDPCICGIKEPKIAVLLWVLSDNKKELDDSEKQTKDSNIQEKSKIKRFFKKIFK